MRIFFVIYIMNIRNLVFIFFIIFKVNIKNFLIYIYNFLKFFLFNIYIFFIILGKILYIDYDIILYFIPHSISLIYFQLFLNFILFCCYVYIDSLYFNFTSFIIKFSYFLYNGQNTLFQDGWKEFSYHF